MTDTRVALGSDRLPWLDDEPVDRRRSGGREPWIVGGAVVVLVAGASYWLGIQSRTFEPVPAPEPPRPAVTTQLPEAQTMPPAEQMRIAPAPEVQQLPAPEVRQVPAPVPRPTIERRTALPDTKAVAEAVVSAEQAERTETPAAKQEVSGTAERTAPPAATTQPALASAQSLRLWPSRVTAGAYGRVVQIGAFGSRHQAKLGWRHMARAYPGVKRLPAVVVEARNSRGRKFYRFQIGTTSQAHSEVLCQRMQKIRFSCAVVGLPWKEKVER